MPPPATAGRGCAWCASPSTFCRQCRSCSPAGSDLTSRERPAASPRGSHPATSRPWGRQACPAGSAPASALDSMLRCRPRRGRSGACHDGRQQRRRTPCFHMTVPAHYRRTSPQDAAPRPRGKVPPASRNCRTGMAPHGAGNLGYGRLPHCTGRLRRQRPLRTADGKDGRPDARQAPPVFRERFGPGHGKRHFPAGTAT